MESHDDVETGIDTEHDGPLTAAEQEVVQAGLKARGYRTHEQIAEAIGISRSAVSKMLVGARTATRRTRRDVVELLRGPVPPPSGGTLSAYPGIAGAAPIPTRDLERNGGMLRPLPVYRANEAKPAMPPLTAWPPPELFARLAGGFGVLVTSDTLAGYRHPAGARLVPGDTVWISTFDLEQGWLRAGEGQVVAALVDFPDLPNEPAGTRLVLRVYGGTPAAPRLQLQRPSDQVPQDTATQEHTLLGVAIWLSRGIPLNGMNPRPPRALSVSVR